MAMKQTSLGHARTCQHHGAHIRVRQTHSLRQLKQHRHGHHVVCNAHSDTVVITGASAGIGKATSLLLARQGWHVFAGVRKPEDGKALQEECAAHSTSDTSASQQGLITPVIIDVTQPDTIATAAAQVKAALTEASSGNGASHTPVRLTGLINNAGKCTLAPLEHMPIEVFEDQLQVNLVGVLRVSQAFLPLMRVPTGAPQPDRTARILNISSQSGTVALPLFGGYCASKFGLEALNDVLKYELDGQGIDVICIKPGPVKSEIWSRAKGTSNQALQSVPKEAWQRYGTLIDKVGRGTQKAEDNGGTCDELAELLRQALTTDKPRARYLFGKSATLQMIVRKLLPDRWWDPILLSSINKL